MRFEDTETLEFNQHEKSDNKASVIYADLESFDYNNKRIIFFFFWKTMHKPCKSRWTNPLTVLNVYDMDVWRYRK